jgi:pimeloyl-ACP methyl ester carboxylesterase
MTMSEILQLAPPARTVLVPGRGEMLVRDSGPETAQRGTLLLLHGWMFGADLNWILAYGPLQQAGYRVLAVDHRGHGRGIRNQEPFRLKDCADDCAALLRVLDTGPVTVVGYSMGGAITQLLARDHPDVVEAIVLCATTDQWRDNRRMRVAWKTIGALEFAMTHMSNRFWARLLRRSGMSSGEVTDWILSELERNDARSVAEAGREMARYDARAWIGKLRVPAAVICPRQDDLVPPHFQRQLAADIPGARLYELEGGHVVVSMDAERYNRVLLHALSDLEARQPASEAASA